MSRIDDALRKRGQSPLPASDEATLADDAPTPAAHTEATAAAPAAPPDLPADDAAASSPWKFDDLPPRRGPRDEGATRLERPRLIEGGRRDVPLPDADREAALVRGFNKVVAEKIVVTSSVPQASVEQYRRLAATLHHAQADRDIRVVMVTSAVAGEGKTLTATNLALTLSESYKRHVLLIDGDLRRPSLHDVFQIPNVSGLTDGLKAEAERKLTVTEVSNGLSVLTAGKPDPDPMGGLTSSRMRRIVEEAAERFDWVVVDTPPVALLTDANLLAAMVDVAVVVVHAGRTPYHLVERAVDAVGREKVMGVVLNRAEDVSTPDDYSYNRYYYGYGVHRHPE